MTTGSSEILVEIIVQRKIIGKDGGKVTMESLQEITNALSNGTTPDSLQPPLPQDWGFATPSQKCNRYYLRNG